MPGETTAASFGRLTAMFAGTTARRRVALLTASAMICAAMVVGCYMRRRNNWDEIAYTGAAISWSVESAKEVRALTYHYVAQATTNKTFNLLVNGPPAGAYREAVYRNPGAFALQLPIEKDKPLYIALVWVAWKIGLNPIRAQAAISALAAGCLGLIVACILVEELGALTLIALPLVLVGSKLFATGRLATPDALSALVVFSGLWLIRKRQSHTSHLGLALLSLAVWVRVDNIILLLLSSALLAIAAYRDSDMVDMSAVKLSVYPALGIGSWLAIRALLGGYGWEVMIHLAFVKHIVSAKGIGFHWSDYGAALRFGEKALVPNHSFPLMLMLGIAVLYRSATGHDPEYQRDACILAAGLIYMIAHFVLFPEPFFRFFDGIYVLIAILALIQLRDAVVALRGATEKRGDPARSH